MDGRVITAMHYKEDGTLALDREAEHVARFRIHIVAEQQPRAVADVLDGMRQVVDEPRGDAAEHRLPLLALHFFLELPEPIGHGVERVPEGAEFVAGADVHARVELPRGARATA